VASLKVSVIVFAVLLSGCSWFHAKKPVAPPPAEFIVTGAPVGSLLFVDGVQAGQAKEAGHQSQVVAVAPGTHILEVKVGDAVVYREDSDIDVGKKRVITVLSGANRY
jgi:hypothetical protein